LKKVLIFGHAGFSGSYMMRYLQSLPDLKIYGIDQIKSNIIEEYQEDLTHFDPVNRIIEQIRPDYILNLSGMNQSDDPSRLYTANVFPVIHAIRSLIGHEMHHTNLLIISSAAVYGDNCNDPLSEENQPNPVNLYGASKLAMEQLITAFGKGDKCRIKVVRTFNLIGPGLSDKLSIPSFIQRIMRASKDNADPIIKVGNLKPRRDYIDIRDAVKGYWKIVTEGKPGEIYNLGSGKSYMMEEIMDVLVSALGVRVRLETDNVLVRKNEIMNSRADISKIKSLGWLPETELEKSLRDMIELYQLGN
jgi:GDP-4-dehydro-6-deoxy-D-mannose reductase